MAVDNTLTPSDDFVDYGDAQSTTRNTTQMSDRSAGTSNSVARFMQQQKLDTQSPGHALGGQEDYCPCDGGFSIR